jgi:hypothetical protein
MECQRRFLPADAGQEPLQGLRIARNAPLEPPVPPRPSHYPAFLLSQNASAAAFTSALLF